MDSREHVFGGLEPSTLRLLEAFNPNQVSLFTASFLVRFWAIEGSRRRRRRRRRRGVQMIYLFFFDTLVLVIQI